MNDTHMNFSNKNLRSYIETYSDTNTFGYNILQYNVNAMLVNMVQRHIVSTSLKVCLHDFSPVERSIFNLLFLHTGYQYLRWKMSNLGVNICYDYFITTNYIE